MEGKLKQILEDEALSTRLLRTLVESSYDSILVTDATKASRIVYANKAFQKLTGFTPSEVMGKTPRILQGPGTERDVIARLARALKERRKFEGRAINYRKDGRPFVMAWRVLPIRQDRDVKLWVAIQREASGSA